MVIDPVVLLVELIILVKVVPTNVGESPVPILCAAVVATKTLASNSPWVEISVTPANKFNSATVAVIPSSVFSSATLAVIPSNIFSSEAVAVICVPFNIMSLVYTLAQDIVLLPKSKVIFALGIILELISAENVIWSVAASPKVRLPLIVASPYTVRSPPTVTDLDTPKPPAVVIDPVVLLVELIASNTFM